MKDSFINRKFTYKYSNAVLYLIAVNVIIFFLSNFVDLRIMGLNIRYWMFLYPPMIRSGFIWQFVTYMFIHTDAIHLLFNMYALYMFGTFVEARIGSKEFVLYYFICGVLGGVISYFINCYTGQFNTAILGASGAVYAVMFLTAITAPTARVLMFFFIPMKLAFAVLVFLIIEIVEQVFGSSEGIAHLVHLSSVLIGYLYCLIRFRISPYKVLKESLIS